MNEKKRTWQEYSNEEKLIAIESYLGGMNSLETTDKDTHNSRLQWLREHIPSYALDGGKNYIFISYSHKDFAKVYRDLSSFLYNSYKTVRFWYDEGLPVGKNWANEAKRYIENPNCVGAIFYISENMLTSPSVLKEIEMIEKSGKPYVAISLEEDKYSAAAILKGRQKTSSFELLDKMFPDADTALTYGEDYENVLYRINKIEETFNVTDDVLSDFVCKDVYDGLALVEYKGNKTEVFIPEKINDKPIVAVRAAFDTAEMVFLPKSVKRVESPSVPEDDYQDIQDESTATVYRMIEHLIGGYEKPTAPLGEAENLFQIHVDDDNPYLFDKGGVLYDRQGTILRMPPKLAWSDEILDGVERIGDGAFYGCVTGEECSEIPEFVQEIGYGAFANSRPTFMGLGMCVNKIGESAFADSVSGFPLIDLQGEMAKVEDWTFKNATRIDAVWLPESVQTIGRGAFFGSSVQLVTMGTFLEEIEDGAFALCHSLDTVSLPDGLKKIGAYAFCGCDQLLTVTLPSSLEYIGENAFDDCTSLKYVYYNGTRKQLYQVQTGGEGLPMEFLAKVICKNEIFRRFGAKIKRGVRKVATKILEKV